jgi:hypothetical protein
MKRLTALLKEKTEQLDKAMTELEKKAGEARKIIKLDMPQSTWREFGINDKALSKQAKITCELVTDGFFDNADRQKTRENILG